MPKGTLKPGLAKWIANGNRPHVTHGIRGFLASGALPTAVAEQVNYFRVELITQLGGEREINVAQAALVRTSVLALTVIELVQDWLAKPQGIGPGKKLDYAFRYLVSFGHLLRRNLQALGVDLKVQAPPSPAPDPGGDLWGEPEGPAPSWAEGERESDHPPEQPEVEPASERLETGPFTPFEEVADPEHILGRIL